MVKATIINAKVLGAGLEPKKKPAATREDDFQALPTARMSKMYFSIISATGRDRLYN